MSLFNDMACLLKNPQYHILCVVSQIVLDALIWSKQGFAVIILLQFCFHASHIQDYYVNILVINLHILKFRYASHFCDLFGDFQCGRSFPVKFP